MVNQLDQLAYVVLGPSIETLRQDLERKHAGEYFRLWIADKDNRRMWDRLVSRFEAARDDLDTMADVAQRDIVRRYRKTMTISFAFIGVLVIAAIAWNAYLLRRFPRTRFKWKKLAISIGISCLLIFTTEVMFFLLITRRLKAASPELLAKEFLRGAGDITRQEWRNLTSIMSPPPATMIDNEKKI